MNMLGALWVTTSRDGKKKFLTGEINGIKVIIFKAFGKKNERSPDFIIYESNTVPPARHRTTERSAEKARLDELLV